MFRNRDKIIKIVVWAVVLSMMLTIFATVASIFAR